MEQKLKALNKNSVRFRKEVLEQIKDRIRESRRSKAFFWAWLIHIQAHKGFEQMSINFKTNIRETMMKKAFNRFVHDCRIKVNRGLRKFLKAPKRLYQMKHY